MMEAYEVLLVIHFVIFQKSYSNEQTVGAALLHSHGRKFAGIPQVQGREFLLEFHHGG
jgi:hypothetical protein